MKGVLIFIIISSLTTVAWGRAAAMSPQAAAMEQMETATGLAAGALGHPAAPAAQSAEDPPLVTSNDPALLWLMELGEKGLDFRGDTLILGSEAQRLLEDEDYRELVYPDTYTWEQAVWLIENQELKMAFWYFINLYPESQTNKEVVVNSILAYDRLFRMDEMMANTFYTYCFTDPKVSHIVDGTPEVVRPDLLEEKLRSVREIVGYIHYFRNQQDSASQDAPEGSQ